MGQTTQLRIDIGTQVPSSKSDMRNKSTGFRNSIIFLLPKQRLAPKLFLPKQIEIWFVTLPFTSFYCIRGWERKQKRFAMSLVSGIKYTPIKKDQPSHPAPLSFQPHNNEKRTTERNPSDDEKNGQVTGFHNAPSFRSITSRSATSHRTQTIHLGTPTKGPGAFNGWLVGWLVWLLWLVVVEMVGRLWLVGWLVRQVVVGLWFHGTGNRSLSFSQLESLVGFLGYVYPMKSGEKFI